MHIGPGDQASARVRYFNADGSDAGLCGNGARCAAIEASRLGLGGSELTLDFGNLVVTAELRDDNVRVGLGPLREEPVALALEVEGRRVELYRVNTGVPHAIVVVPSVEATPVEALGRALRGHAAFGPAGTNVDFVERRSSGAIPMRTYERGVERETLACGTGAVAVAVVAARVWGRVPPIEIATRGGERLRVHLEHGGTVFSNMVLEGGATMVFAGEIEVEGIAN
jgi:diaminopimelate epimerase